MARNIRVFLNGLAQYKFVSFIWNQIRNTKIQIRLMVSFIILSSFPLFITGYFSYDRSSEAIRSKISTYSLQLIDQVGKNIDDQLARLINDSISIEFSNVVQDALVYHEHMSEWERLQLYNTMHSFFIRNFSYLNYASNVFLITKNRYNIIVYGDIDSKLIIQPNHLDMLFTKVIPQNGRPVWSPLIKEHLVTRMGIRNEEGIMLSRSIQSTEGRRDTLLIIKVRKKLFEDIYKNIKNMGTNADIFIINSEGIVMSNINPNITFAERYQDDALIKRVTSTRRGGQVFDLSMNGDKYMVATYPLQHADWYVVSTIPFSYLNYESKIFGIYIGMLGIFCFLLAMLLSLLISKSISIPLSQLIYSMNRAKRGALDERVIDNHSDEVAEVSKYYNAMLTELKGLLEEVKNKEIQKRKAEFKALQAQIDPHFLSNTLNTIRNMAVKQKASNIEEIITTLIQLLHVCMGKGDEFIYIYEEIDYIKSYLKIQEYKYYNHFNVHFNIDNEILNCRIPRFLLQPIVENALIHGLSAAKSNRLILIKGYRMDEDIRISVIDNGIGMTKNKIKAILEGRESSKSRMNGIGINNVNERIQMIFGERYKINIESAPNLFTNVEITIPFITEEKTNVKSANSG